MPREVVRKGLRFSLAAVMHRARLSSGRSGGGGTPVSRHEPDCVAARPEHTRGADRHSVGLPGRVQRGALHGFTEGLLNDNARRVCSA